MSKYNRLVNLHRQLVDTLGPELSVNGRVLWKLAKDAYGEAFYRTGYVIQENARAAGNWGLLSPDLVRAAVEKPVSGLTLRGVWTRAQAGALSDIERAIIAGTVQGESYERMAKRVRKVFDTNVRRARVIARTEGHRMMIEGQIQATERGEELGIALKRVWDATLDKSTRPSHQAMDGKVAELHNGRPQFYMGSIGRWVDGPGLTGEASEDINCRCALTTVVEGYEPKTRKARNEYEENVDMPYLTYEEWADALSKR